MMVLLVTTVVILSTISVTESGCFGKSQYFACKLIYLEHKKRITLWEQHPSGVKDDAYAYNNIWNAFLGKAASRSNYTCSECRSPGAPGRSVCLSRILLEYIYEVHKQLDYIHVNEVAGACQSCKPKRYLGCAVDLHYQAEERRVMLNLCESMDGWGKD